MVASAVVEGIGDVEIGAVFVTVTGPPMPPPPPVMPTDTDGFNDTCSVTLPLKEPEFAPDSPPPPPMLRAMIAAALLPLTVMAPELVMFTAAAAAPFLPAPPSVSVPS